MSEHEKSILDAERRIAKILAELERTTGRFVEGIDIKNVEVTTYTDKLPQWRRSVVIDLKRLPGSEWST